MDSIGIFRKAIQKRHPVKFTYNRPGKTPGIRIGNAHAIYEYVTKAGLKSIKVDIAQTGGVSDSQEPFPSFRMFDLVDLNVHDIDTNAVFQTHPDYNPEGNRYVNCIEKI